MLNKPATAREKIRVHLTVFIPADGITCFDGTESRQKILGKSYFNLIKQNFVQRLPG